MTVSPATDDVTDSCIVELPACAFTQLKCCLIGPDDGTAAIDDNVCDAIFCPDRVESIRDPVDPDGYSKYPVMRYSPAP